MTTNLRCADQAFVELLRVLDECRSTARGDDYLFWNALVHRVSTARSGLTTRLLACGAGPTPVPAVHPTDAAGRDKMRQTLVHQRQSLRMMRERLQQATDGAERRALETAMGRVAAERLQLEDLMRSQGLDPEEAAASEAEAKRE